MIVARAAGQGDSAWPHRTPCKAERELGRRRGSSSVRTRMPRLCSALHATFTTSASDSELAAGRISEGPPRDGYYCSEGAPIVEAPITAEAPAGKEQTSVEELALDLANICSAVNEEAATPDEDWPERQTALPGEVGNIEAESEDTSTDGSMANDSDEDTAVAAENAGAGAGIADAHRGRIQGHGHHVWYCSSSGSSTSQNSVKDPDSEVEDMAHVPHRVVVLEKRQGRATDLLRSDDKNHTVVWDSCSSAGSD